jgi:quinolinate synthase
MKNKILQLKEKLGTQVAILAHHYQAQEIVEIADLTGDSLELAQKIPHLTAKYLIFCGVHFMGETAAILAAKGQKVFMPEPQAGCVMANTAPTFLVQKVVEELTSLGKKVIPLTYVNSTAEIKALCGSLGGSTCTSANARQMLSWALKQGDLVLFLPDKNLGQNTGKSLGLSAKDMATISLTNLEELKSIVSKKLLLWPGVCAVHFKYKPKHLIQIRQKDSQARIVVHPECSPEVVSLSDANGSTSFIIKYVKNAPAGSKIYVGTEENLVKRLQKTYQGQKEVLSLYPVCCSNMARTRLEQVLETLEHFPAAKEITVSEKLSTWAKKALTTMFEVCS